MGNASQQLPDPNAAYQVVQVDGPQVTDRDWSEEGDGWVLVVACPRCGHNVDKRFGPVVLSQFRGNDTADAVMRCNCPDAHDGRDAGQGCGAWWGFAVERAT